MATQGMVTVQEAGKVVMKVVAGCDGYNAKKLAKWLEKNWPVSANEAYKKARKMNFGNTETLVVMTETEVQFKGDSDLPPRYRETFSQSTFNPHWESGKADRLTIITVKSQTAP